MENENRRNLKQNIASIPCDNEKEIELIRGAGRIGTEVIKLKDWKSNCSRYFNRYYKDSSIITMPCENDMIVNTLNQVCSKNKGRGFVFKDYNIVKHLEFCGFDKDSLDRKLGITVTKRSISYLAYIEQKNVILVCEKIINNCSVKQNLKNIVTFIKYFLTLYSKEIERTRVTIVGLLIRENGNVEELLECKFCSLFNICSGEVFKSLTTFNNWWDLVETYGGWWNLVNPTNVCKLFEDLASHILCFMALDKKKGLPSLTDDLSQQFKQTYFLYTPQQMNILFSDAKHVIIQGSYGSGKSILGLKKLQLIVNHNLCCSQAEKIIYINFDRNSKLHFQMEKDVKEYVRICPSRVKLTNNIREILESPKVSVYVYHNSKGENLSAILQETVKFRNARTSKIAKTRFHVIVEEFEGEMLTHEETAKINKLMKRDVFEQSNIVILAQPLRKKRSWKVDNKCYNKETFMFHELKNTFRIVKLEKVLRSSNEICRITKATQKYVRNKESIFTTELDKQNFEKQKQSEEDKGYVTLSYRPQDAIDLDSNQNPAQLETSINESFSSSRNNINKTDEKHEHAFDLDQAFEKVTTLQKASTGKNVIVSNFDFVCEPTQGVDIKGGKPKVIRFSEKICSTSDMAVIALASALSEFIRRTKTTTLLYLTNEKPEVLKRALQLFPALLADYSYTDNTEEYIQKSKQSKMIFSSNFRRVNGMEFDHVVILVKQSEYYLKYYLPQVMSRCTYDLNLVLLPKGRQIEESKKTIEAKGIVEEIIEELKQECLMNQMDVVECQICKEDSDCYCITNETDNKLILGLHTYSDQYKSHLISLKEKMKSKDQVADTTALAEAT